MEDISALPEEDAMRTESIITADVSQAAEYICTSWRQGVEAIIETGRRLAEIKEKFKDARGKWSMLIGANSHERGLLPFGPTHAKRLVAIANSSERLGPHVDLLPSDSFTLHQLTRLSDDHFYELLEDGRTHTLPIKRYG